MILRCSSNVYGDSFLNNFKMKVIGFENFLQKIFESEIQIG